MELDNLTEIPEPTEQDREEMLNALNNSDLDTVIKYWEQYRNYYLERYNKPFNKEEYIESQKKITGKMPSLGEIELINCISQALVTDTNAEKVARAESHLGNMALIQYRRIDAVSHFTQAVAFALNNSATQDGYQKSLDAASTQSS